MKKTTRQQQKEETRKELIRTAYRLFSDQGILCTRMSDIALAAGVSHGTVFLHFSTQEALITQVVELYCGEIAEHTHEPADSGGSLRDVLTAHLKGIGEFEPFYTRLVIENRLLPTGARDAWINLQSVISFHISQALSREIESGAVPVPHDMLFNLWIGLVHHYLANGDLFVPGEHVIEHCGQALIDNYLKLVKGH